MGTVEQRASVLRIYVRQNAPAYKPSKANVSYRCLSVKWPWIALLGDKRKPFELRKRVSHYRGTVVLCSSASPSRTDDARKAVERYKPPEVPLGHALYLAELATCYPAEAKDALGACCMPSEGEYVWHFVNVRALPKPQPISGLLGLYYPPDDLARYLKRARLL